MSVGCTIAEPQNIHAAPPHLENDVMLRLLLLLRSGCAGGGGEGRGGEGRGGERRGGAGRGVLLKSSRGLQTCPIGYISNNGGGRVINTVQYIIIE